MAARSSKGNEIIIITIVMRHKPPRSVDKICLMRCPFNGDQANQRYVCNCSLSFQLHCRHMDLFCKIFWSLFHFILYKFCSALIPNYYYFQNTIFIEDFCLYKKKYIDVVKKNQFIDIVNNLVLIYYCRFIDKYLKYFFIDVLKFTSF